MTTTYTTRSGSIYVVRVLNGATEVQRTKLGQHHYDRGPAQLAKREADGLSTWRQCRRAECAGPGHILRIYFDSDTTADLYTSPVTNVRVTL